jgi:hypothetical protein
LSINQGRSKKNEARRFSIAQEMEFESQGKTSKSPQDITLMMDGEERKTSKDDKGRERGG